METICCDICKAANNPETILQCSVCDLGVHKTCFHSRMIPTDDEWLCNVCAEGLLPADITCRLCLESGGCFIRCWNAPWVHYFCALLTHQLLPLPHNEKQVRAAMKKSGCIVTLPVYKDFNQLSMDRFDEPCTMCEERGCYTLKCKNCSKHICIKCSIRYLTPSFKIKCCEPEDFESRTLVA